MKLKKVSIINFRSIKEAHINFDTNCKILVGINESGKSNVLKALSCLSPNYEYSNLDIREPFGSDETIKGSKVIFTFTLEGSDVDSAINLFAKLTNNVPVDQPLITEDGIPQTFEDIIAKSQACFINDIKKKTSNAAFSPTKKEIIINENFVKLSRRVASVETNLSGVTHRYKSGDFVWQPMFSSKDDNNFEKVSVPEFTALIAKVLIDVAEKSLPKVFFWKYEDNQILPETIHLDSFVNDPSSCPPLRNLFFLANITDIANAINEAKEKTAVGLTNLLNRVASTATDYFHDVWQEYPEIKINLKENGVNLNASVLDSKNLYSFKERSDGFKQFVSFLLMISTQVKKNKINNDLLIIDEPGTNLHPTGCRYLRDELLRIANTNYVVYSTHSIFMIDKKRLNTHLIIKKSKETTIIETVNESNYMNEEVLYNALGYTIFESLKKTNILLEGWKDYKLLQKALSNIPTQFSDVEKINEYGLCYAHGCKEFKNLSSIFQLMDRKCIFLSDADKAAKDSKKLFVEQYGYGVWLDFDDLKGKDNYKTSEDFIKAKGLERALKSAKQDFPWIPEKPAEWFKDVGILKQMDSEFQKNFITHRDEFKNAINKFKGYLFENLDNSEIKDAYYDLLISLLKEIEKTTTSCN